jgi:hypothetical protein
MTETLEPLRTAKTVLLRTCKRDGTPVPTPERCCSTARGA